MIEKILKWLARFDDYLKSRDKVDLALWIGCMAMAGVVEGVVMVAVWSICAAIYFIRLLVKSA